MMVGNRSAALMWWYRVLYVIGLLCMVPWLMWTQFVRRKPQNLWKRLFPPVKGPLPGSGPIVWVHAVSVGEVHAISPVVASLRKARPQLRFVVSTTTQTGQDVAKKILPYAAAHLFMPFDVAFSVRRALLVGFPTLVVFSEGDVWPCFMNEVRRQGAMVAVVNAKISMTTARRFQRWRSIGQWLYSFVDLFCFQSQELADRARRLGVPESAIHVTGSTKADVRVSLLSEDAKTALRRSLGLIPTDRVIVLGSTHEGEEGTLIGKIEPIIRTRPGVRLVVVPRHPERFSAVYDQVRGAFRAVARLSTYNGSEPWGVMVVDQLGQLTQLYQIASVAIVCGSFVEHVGGHNILEPAVVGVPTVVGPYMHSQQALFESAKASSAVLQVTYETLAQTICRLLDDPEAWFCASTAATAWARALQGATEKTVKLLLGNTRIE
jgi:3-deoxy-D-manno-octulosonic-acid transferase